MEKENNPKGLDNLRLIGEMIDQLGANEPKTNII